MRGTALLLALCLSQPSFSQTSDRDDQEDDFLDSLTLDAEPAPEITAPRKPPPQLVDELVVTATPSGDTLFETPISVSVTSELELRETDITDVEVLSDRLPNAQLALTPTNTFLFVRGLGTGSVRSAEQSVGFFVDGVFLGRPQGALYDFLDLDQVELLRGPQGAILGKNTVAGAVNVRTASASDETEVYAQFLAGSDDRVRGRGAASGALSETLAGRIAYTQTDEQGFLFNTTQQRHDLAQPGRSGRAKLLWTPGDTQQYGLSVQASRLRQIGDSFQLSQASEQVLALYRLYDPQTSTDITDFRTHTDHSASGGLIDGLDLIAHAQWDPPFGRLKLTLNHSQQDALTDLDLDISPAPFLTLPADEAYRQSSIELRFDRLYDWGDISGGIYAFASDLDLAVDITVFDDGGAAFAAPLLDRATGTSLVGELLAVLGDLAPALALGRGASHHLLLQDQTTYSAFGSVRWDLAPRWTLRLDGRFTRETKDGDQRIEFEGASGVLLGQALGEEEYRLIASRTEFDFSPRLSLLVELSDQLNSYLTVARGFKSGGFNNLAAVAERAEFDAERSLTYEAGIRLRTAIGLRGELGVFRTEFDNLQVAALDGTEFFVGNAAQAHTQGVELSLQWGLPYGIQLGADLGYLDAQYDSYRNAPAQTDSDEDSQDLSGRVLQRAPDFSGSLQLAFVSVLPLLDLPFAVGAVAEGASHQFLNIDLDPIDSQPGYVRYNAFAVLGNPSESLSLRLIGRNLGDAVVRREAADVALVGAHSVGVFAPRSVAVELGLQF